MFRDACNGRRGVWIVCGALAAVSLRAQPSAGQAQESPGLDQARIDGAIKRGAGFLLEAAKGLPSQEAWHGEQARADYDPDELILYTLIRAGVDRSEASFQKLLERALGDPPTRTYRVSLAAMALQELGDEAYVPRILECAHFLVDNQCENGQWSYGEPAPLPKAAVTSGAASPAPAAPAVQGPPSKGSGAKPRKRVPVARRRKGPPTGDNSNSQYAALGLRACLEAGCDVPLDVLTRARDGWERTQSADGGWSYGEPCTGSMTAGAVGALAIYRFLLREPVKNDPAIARGIQWLGRRFTVTENPGDPPQAWDRQHYYLYALERVGMLVGLDRFGSHDWYAQGARHLLERQGAGGDWSVGKPAHQKIVDTCYAILFLRRATKPLPKINTR